MTETRQERDTFKALLTSMRHETWRQDAACRGLDPNAFFPRRGAIEEYRAAMRVCFACPVKLQCLDHAMREREPHGVWGGTSDNERRRIYHHWLHSKAEFFEELQPDIAAVATLLADNSIHLGRIDTRQLEQSA